MIRKRRKIQVIGQQIFDINSQNDEVEFLEASFTFVPKAPNTKQLVVTLHQQKFYDRVSIPNPVLSFSALLPDNSKVFRLIESGDLEGLIRILILGEARLSDRDSSGRSLLNVSVTEIDRDWKYAMTQES